MKADNSRFTFDRANHYTGVRLQQGRVAVDADWNEQIDIAAYLDETANVDVIGISGASRISGGFQLVAVPGDLIITPGRMWIDGILCEADAGPSLAVSTGTANSVVLAEWPADAKRLAAGSWLEVSGRLGTTPTTQYARIQTIDPLLRTITFAAPLTPAPDAIVFVRAVWSYTTQPHDPAPPPLPANGIAYLDVWTRHLTAIEDDRMREIALGGPDTATRTQTIWQVRLDLAAASCAAIASPVPSSRLTARTSAVPQSSDPCIIPARAGYRGLANQLYRIEVHRPTGDPNGPTFKWSRDNGAFVFSIESAITATQLRLHSLGRDDRFGIEANDWVEIFDDVMELQGRPGIIARVLTTPQQDNRILAIDPATLSVDLRTAIDHTRGPRVRLWSHDPAINGGRTEVAITTGATPIQLESGIEVLFSGSAFLTGEYWLVPARTAINDETGDIEWPRHAGVPIPQPPRGIAHHHAALAEVAAGAITDCRPLFSPLAAPEFFYVGGDGQEIMPDLLTQPHPSADLRFPLQVGVANGGPIANATVEFTILTGNGTLDGGASPKSVETDPDGIASVRWSLDPDTPHQQCRARLLKGNGYDPVNLPPIDFNAHLSVASQVAYDTKNCPELERRRVRTVQEALDAHCDILDDQHLYFVGGDGQEAPRTPGLSPLPLTIDVGVASALGPLPNQVVEFTPSDNGSIDGQPAGSTASVSTGPDGIARVPWALNGSGPGSQTATARLPGAAAGLPVIFKASLATPGGVCTIQLQPGPGWEIPLRQLPPGADAEICFAVGDFPLIDRVTIANAGTLKFTGGGRGTRILSEDGAAFVFQHCIEVVMRDLAVSAKQQPDRGVLLFLGCGTVTLEALHVRCASGEERTGACIAVDSKLDRGFLPPPLAEELERRSALVRSLSPSFRGEAGGRRGDAATVVRVSDCELNVGNAQIGVMAIDPMIAWIGNNVVVASPEFIPLERLLRNPRARAPWRRLLIANAWAGNNTPPRAPRNVEVLVGDQIPVQFLTFDEDLAGEWNLAAQQMPPRTFRDAIRRLRKFAGRILFDPAFRSTFPKFNEFFDRVLQGSKLAVADAGILVGGFRVGEVQIVRNSIGGAAEGVRVGVNSEQGIARLQRLEVCDNFIRLEETIERRARHGIYVGAGRSVLVQRNMIDCARIQPPEDVPNRIEGVRLVGKTFGPMIGVEANHLRGCDLVVVPRLIQEGKVQWYATDNLTEQPGKEDIAPIVRQNPPNVIA